MRIIMCWKAENGEYYRDKDRAMSMSPNGVLEEVWGESDPLVVCPYVKEEYRTGASLHNPECRGPGDVINHIMPILRTKSISQLMGLILQCCGDNVSGARSCGCTHSARVLIEKLKGEIN